MKNNKKVKPITLEIDEGLWKEFKDLTPRSLTLNEMIVKLIVNCVLRYKRDKENFWKP